MAKKRHRKKTRRRKKSSLLARWMRRFRRWLHGWRLVLPLLGFVGIVGLNLMIGHKVWQPTWFLTENFDGIDVSKYQGNINWNRVSRIPNIQFVYVKATEGATHVDKNYQENIRKARAAGLRVGSYHFFVSHKTPKEQFANFHRYVRRNEQDLLPMVDVEHTGNRSATRQQLQQNLAEFMELVKGEYGQYPLIYSQYKFYNDMLAPEFNKYLIFIARYSDSQPILKGEGKYNIWQFTERGHIDGIKEKVDLNRFANGTTINDIMLK